MKEGSIVGLVRRLSLKDLDLLRDLKVYLEREVPYVIKEGPRYRPLTIEGKSYIVQAITLEEYPGIWLNISYFAEMQSPGEISAEEIVASCVPAMVAACL
jgi:hypothetical protein